MDAVLALTEDDWRSFRTWVRAEESRYRADHGAKDRDVRHEDHGRLTKGAQNIRHELESVSRALAAIIIHAGPHHLPEGLDLPESVVDEMSAILVRAGESPATYAVYELRCQDDGCASVGGRRFMRPVAIEIQSEPPFERFATSVVCPACRSVTVLWVDEASGRPCVRCAPELRKRTRFGVVQRDPQLHPMATHEIYRWVGETGAPTSREAARIVP